MLTRKKFLIVAGLLALLVAIAIPVAVSAAPDGKAGEEGMTLARRVALNLRLAERAVRRSVHDLNQVDRLAYAAQNRLERMDKALQEGGARDAHVEAALNKLASAKEAADRAKTMLKEAQVEIDAALQKAEPEAGAAQPTRPARKPSQTQ